jgi:hypothetical protein
MIILQTSEEVLSPILSLVQNQIVTTSAGTTELTHRSAIYNQSSTASYYNEYTALGNGEQISIVSQSIANALNISAFPKITRNSGVNSYVTAQFSNGRSTTNDRVFDFRTTNSSDFKYPAHSSVAGSLLEITANIVGDLAAAMTSNVMWDGNSNRAQTSVIPHQYLTGHVWKGGNWGIPGIVGGQGSGRRFMAVTKRHVQACGHYQYYVGETLLFKDVNNNIISRQVIEVVCFNTEIAGAPIDLSIYLLDQDLPSSITILPVMGAWGKGIVSETSETFTVCPQFAGILLNNNDGHLTPCIAARQFDETIQKGAFTYQGLNFDRSKLYSAIGDQSTTIKSFPSSSVGDKFYHDTRAGDSGSPFLVPCLGGWCYASHFSTNNHPTSSLFNDLIAFIDARAIASGVLPSATGYTVTVAQPPTA